jgi:type VI secretion system protein ImpC
MSESFQHKLGRVRPPRVQITYDVEIGGDVVKKELPFVVGIMADLSGMPDKELPERPDPATRDGKRLPAEGPKEILPLRERNYVEIDRDNFNVVMQSIGPRLAFTVGALTAEQAEAGDREGGAGRKTWRIAPELDENGEQRLIRVALEFKNMDDFSPVQVVRQVEPLRKLFEARTHLAGLLTKLEGDDQLSHGLPEDILKETDNKKPNQERVAQIDELLTAHLDKIMHDDRFRRLEASWRGLHYLVSNTETSTSLKLRLLNAKKEEVLDDLKKAIEFDQSVQFKRLYEDEYGTWGGHPFSVLVADYEFGRDPDDFEFLDKMSGVAAAAHAPFIAAASPKLFDMESFTELGKPRDLARIFESAELIKWRSFRESEDSRYVALTLPHILMRLPYGPDASPVEEFDYREDVDGRGNSKYLWGNPAYALGARITDAFAKYKWPAAIRGVEGGGIVEGLPAHAFLTDEGDVAPKCPTEIAITDRREKELSDLGFISLAYCKNTDQAAFFGVQTARKPMVYTSPQATANARASCQLPYILAASRFVHYIKSIMRDKAGSFMTCENVETYLNTWIADYVLLNDSGSQEAKAIYPLREARVDVSDVPGKPGCYRATVYLRLHFQLEELTASLRLVAELPPPA